MIAHGAILRVYAKNPLIADQMAVNYRKADLKPHQKAMLDFALKVALHSHEISDADFPPLRAHGFSDEDIWDIGAIAALFALSNRMANLINMRPNDEFYLLGRAPKSDDALEALAGGDARPRSAVFIQWRAGDRKMLRRTRLPAPGRLTYDDIIDR